MFITHSIDEAIYLGQRVLVMAATPGASRIRCRSMCPEGRPAEDMRATPEFVRLRHDDPATASSSRRSAGHLQVVHVAEFNFEERR